MIFWWNICHVMKNTKLVFLKQSKHLKHEKQDQTLCTKRTQFSYRKDKEKFNITNESNKKSALFLFYSSVSDSFLCCKYVWYDKIQHKVGWQRKFQSTWNEVSYLGGVCSFSFSCCSKHFGSCYMRSYPTIKGDRQETLNSERTKVWEDV